MKFKNLKVNVDSIINTDRYSYTYWLTLGGKNEALEMELPYTKGKANKIPEPTIEDVMWSLSLDANQVIADYNEGSGAIDFRSYEDWAWEFGYTCDCCDQVKPDKKNMFEDVKRQTEDFIKLLEDEGIDFEELGDWANEQ